MQKLILAIDPGTSGGIAYRDTNLTGETAKPMPQTDTETVALIQALTAYAHERNLHKTAYIEKVGGYIAGATTPGSAMFNFGQGVGLIKGALLALGWRLIETAPQKWQKPFSLGKSKDHPTKTHWKRHLKDTAQKRYPAQRVTLATADALLILEYATLLERDNTVHQSTT